MDIRYHFVRQEVRERTIAFKWVASQNQLADIFTKSLGSVAYKRIRDQLMVRREESE